MTYRLRARAEADLAEIWHYTAGQWSVAQADKYFGELIEALKAIGEHAELGRPCDEIRAGYRRYNINAHVLFYRVDEEGADVVRILHARRDFQRHLPIG